MGEPAAVRAFRVLPSPSHGGALPAAAPPTRKELETCALFADCALEMALPLLESCPVLPLAPGQALLEPDHHNTSVFVLLEGALRVELDLDDEPLCELGAGAVVGELAALDAGKRSARVVATAPSRVLELSRPVFFSLLASSHEITLNLLSILARRLRDSTGQVARGRRLADQYRRHASVDALTGLHNRRWLDEMLPRQLRRAAMQGEPLSVLMIDVDHFKRFNDQWGHAAGDFVLFGVAKLLQAQLRPTDLVARYGGEEMTAILPRTDAAGAEVAAERVRRAIAFTPFEMPDGTVLPNVTVSIGLAQARPGTNAGDLMAAADRALYRAKRNGRNRVERE